mmetsp:Transcript_29183/g.59803  ORF Transcript_29183/g.59803 Transcript_29183/m.59803 type:complete len:205 (-) Transcript_29183:48-662(-)
MGLFLSKIATVFSNTQDTRIVLVGLHAAGKTTVLHRFKLNETVSKLLASGLCREEVQYKNIIFSMFDLGGPGKDKLRPLWKHSYHGCHGVIFMVDSTMDQERVDEARKELQLIVNDDKLRNAAVLVLANKQDLPKAAPVDEIVKALGLLELPSTRKWHVHATNAVTGEGLYEGLEWLAAEVPKAKELPKIMEGCHRGILHHDER